MLDINILRQKLELVALSLATRGYVLEQKKFQDLEAIRRHCLIETQALQAERNALAKSYGRAKTSVDQEEQNRLQKQSQQNNEKLLVCEQKLSELEQQLEELLLDMPNLPHETVPVGQSEQDNVEVRRVGVPASYGFEVRDHLALGEKLSGLDFETAAKMAGSRFSLMSGGVARLHRALTQFMLDTHTQKHGYTECYVPYVVLEEALRGTGQLPKFSADLFQVPWGDGSPHYLIPTAEVPLTNTVRDSVLKESQLPIRLTAHSPCFRSEAGSYGRDVKGLIRQHQFDKVELVQIVHPEQSYLALEELTQQAEQILQLLELPYRVMLLCTKDMGFGASKTYDLEVWLPGQNTYREISSCSNCEAFQARRMKARFKGATGANQFVHTLNGSGVAVGRALVAVLENYQQADGSVRIPEVLQPYMAGMKTLSSKG
jgi:seryl-tRNA synthetase